VPALQIHQDVARMRVGVEEAIDEQLFDERSQDIFADRQAVQPGRVDGRDVADLDPGHEIHRQDFGTAQLRVGLGHADAGHPFHVAGQPLHVI
jgi:hypothetical protein